MSAIFHSSRASLWHAKRRNLELDIELSKWLETGPCELVTEPYEDGTLEIQKLKLVKPVPNILALVAFDALNNLRMALDQAGYSAAIAADKTKGANAHFPFGDDPTSIVARARDPKKGRARDIPQEIFDLIMTFKPYKGGDDFLWTMNRICNSHKHEIIIPTAMVLGTLQIGGSAHPNLRVRAPIIWDRSKNEAELFTFPKGEKIQYNFQFAGNITFADVEIAKDMSVGGFFNNVCATTESIITAIEAKTTELFA